MLKISRKMQINTIRDHVIHFKKKVFIGKNIKAWSPPLVADINMDGILEIIIGTTNGLFIISSWNYSIIARFPIKSYNGFHDNIRIGNVDNDLELEIVALNASITGLDNIWIIDGKNLEVENIINVSVAQFCLADVNNDGKMEIIVRANNTFECFSANGSVIWMKKLDDYVLGISDLVDFAASDIDNDGFPEFIVPARSISSSSSNSLLVFDSNGSLIWCYKFNFTRNEGLSGSLLVADLNDDNEKEVILYSGIKYEESSRIFILNTITKNISLEIECGEIGWSYISTGDINGDDKKEIILVDDFTYHFYIINSQGKVLFNDEIGFGNSCGGFAAVGDVDGDNVCEIIMVTKYRLIVFDFNNLVYYYHELVGGFVSHPVLADIDQDGKFEILFTNSENGPPSALYLYVFSTNGSKIEFSMPGVDLCYSNNYIG